MKTRCNAEVSSIGAAPSPIPRSRPLGVTILAVLTILIGILVFFLGLALTVSAGVFTFFVPLFGLGIVVGFLVLLVGVLMIVSGMGLLRLRMWAWWLAILSFVLGAASSVLSQNYVTAGIEILLIVYLIVVRKHFS